MLPTTPRTEPQQTGEHRFLAAHLAALAHYGSLAIGHRYVVAGLTGLLRLSERVIWRASKCGVCRGRGWVPYLYAVQACGACAGTGYTIGG